MKWWNYIYDILPTQICFKQVRWIPTSDRKKNKQKNQTYLQISIIHINKSTPQLLYLVISTSSIGFLPNGSMKRWANDHATRIFFRIMSRSLSSLITVHNPENKPKSGGICVANHTSTIDVCILSTDTTFSLVNSLRNSIFKTTESKNSFEPNAIVGHPLYDHLFVFVLSSGVVVWWRRRGLCWSQKYIMHWYIMQSGEPKAVKECSFSFILIHTNMPSCIVTGLTNGYRARRLCPIRSIGCHFVQDNTRAIA